MDPNREKILFLWLSRLLQTKIDKSCWVEKLKDGKWLCRLMNKIKPNSIKKFNLGNMTSFSSRENITLFIAEANKMGIPKEVSFRSGDLFYGKNLPMILKFLSVFADKAKNVPSFTGPYIDDVNEIEKKPKSKQEPIVKIKGWKLMPDELKEEILLCCPQPTLYNCYCTDKKLHRMIRNRLVLKTSLLNVHSHKQLCSMFRCMNLPHSQKVFYHINAYYTNVYDSGPDTKLDDMIFKYVYTKYKEFEQDCGQDKVEEVFEVFYKPKSEEKEENWNLTEKDWVEDDFLWQCTLENILLKLLDELFRNGKSFVGKNGEIKDEDRKKQGDRMIRKIILRFMDKKTFQVNELMSYRFGRNPWFQKLLSQMDKLRKDEELSSDEESYYVQEVDKEHLGKPVMYYCRKCGWRLSNFRCLQKSHFLVLQKNGNSHCECGIMKAPKCCNRCMVGVSFDLEKLELLEKIKEVPKPKEKSPVLSCDKCGFGINSGVKCFACNKKKGSHLYREGFYERGLWNNSF